MSLPFRPGDVSWRVAREPVLGLGAAPTLLLQVTHPLVGAGVAQYSDFEHDPFSRLWRTADIMLKLTFGSPEQSRRQSEVLRRMHARVNGSSDEGVPYRALDPDLLMWVWATLAHNALDLYERTFGALPAGERARFYEEQKEIAYACGVPIGHCPLTWDDFLGYFDRVVREELRPTPTARKVIDVGQDLPIPRLIGATYSRINLLMAGALLPPRLRDELGIPWDATRARAFAAIIRANRLAARVTPRPVRHWPTQYMVDRDRPLRLFQQRPARDRHTVG